MIAWFRRKKKNAVAEYRMNRWKGLRASQAVEERQQARRSWWYARCCRVAYISGGIACFGALAWLLAVGVLELGPMVQRGLEIREVRVEGIHQLKKPEVIERLALRKGVALHQVSMTYLAERLRALPWVKEATIERFPLHELRVSIVERTPAATVHAGAEHILVDEEGVVLAHLGPQDDQAVLPLLIGAEVKPLLQGDSRVRQTVQGAIELARAMAHSVDDQVRIDLTNPNGLVASARGLRFQFGSDALIDQWNRYQMVKAVFKPGGLEGRRREGGEVDLRYDNRVIVRERG
jgi:cell division protein FtsQ